MGHDEARARQAALVKFVRLIKASANDMVSEVEAISFTGDITQLSNYELTVVIQQLQAQLFSNLNPHRPSGMPTPAPEPTPATPATPAVSVVEEPAAMNLLESFEYASNQVQNLRERMEQGDRKLYRSVGEFMDSTDSTIQNLAAEAVTEEAWKTRMQQITKYGGASNQPTPTPTPTPEPEHEPEPERKRLSLYSLFQEVGQDYDKLYDALKAYNKPELVRSARSYKIAGKTALLKMTTQQLIEELVNFVKGQRESWGTPTPNWEPAPTPAPRVVAGEPEPGLSWLDNPEAFTL